MEFVYEVIVEGELTWFKGLCVDVGVTISKTFGN